MVQDKRGTNRRSDKERSAARKAARKRLLSRQKTSTRGQRGTRWRNWAWLLLLPLAFYLGRLSAPAEAASGPKIVAEHTSTATTAPELTQNTALTSADCCPCPKKKMPLGPKRIRRKKPQKKLVEPATRPDPSLAAGRFLKAQAHRLDSCAPPTGGTLRLHLELTVTPLGKVSHTRFTNLEPVPEDVSRCISKKMSALKAPSFDATEPATFALTVVL